MNAYKCTGVLTCPSDQEAKLRNRSIPRHSTSNLNALHETIAEHIKTANELYAEYAN
jgi:hypothetical protein